MDEQTVKEVKKAVIELEGAVVQHTDSWIDWNLQWSDKDKQEVLNKASERCERARRNLFTLIGIEDPE